MEEFKKDFPLLNNNNIVYLDSGATSQKPQPVLDAVSEFYKTSNANPHRGAYSLSIEATEKYEESRQKIAKFINAKHTEEIIYTKNATESINLVAYSYGIENLKPGDEIVISIMEHHSNLVPWQKVARVTGAILKYMYINDDYEIPEAEIESKITPKTKIVGITHISNVLGTINNVEKIVKYAHKNGAIVIVDGAQSTPHIKVDVQKLNCDFFVFSGHKMLSPLGIGILYGKREILNNMTPFLMGGDMIEYVHEQETTFAPLPNKFEAGTQNVGGAIGLAAAIDYIQKVGFDEIERIENELTDYAVKRLSSLGFVKLYVTSNKSNHSGVISFNIEGVHPHDVASILDTYGVCIRSRKSLCTTAYEVFGNRFNLSRKFLFLQYKVRRRQASRRA